MEPAHSEERTADAKEIFRAKEFLEARRSRLAVVEKDRIDATDELGGPRVDGVLDRRRGVVAVVAPPSGPSGGNVLCDIAVQ